MFAHVHTRTQREKQDPCDKAYELAVLQICQSLSQGYHKSAGVK
jgi:hypothetical protein